MSDTDESTPSVKCHPICPRTRRPCTAPCTHLERHMPDDGRERKAFGLIPLTCGRPDDAA